MERQEGAWPPLQVIRLSMRRPDALTVAGAAYRKEARNAAGWYIDQIAGGPARQRSAGLRNCLPIRSLMSQVRHASRAFGAQAFASAASQRWYLP